jgi:thiopeptide-type bacteriocin biosynthesis protein
MSGFVPLDFYVLRVPTLAYTQVLEINKVYGHSFETLNEGLKTIFSDRKMQDAILLASPLLYLETMEWINNNSPEISKKLILTLYKYVLRNGFRCTPYGLFSGCSFGSISTQRSLISIQNAQYHKMTRLDMGYIMELVKLIGNSEFIVQSRLFTNTSLYVIGSTYRYCEYKMTLGKREYFLSEIERTPYLDKVIEAANQGVDFRDLITLLADQSISTEEATLFIEDLIEMQVLEPDFNPKLTSSNILGTLINQLKAGKYKNGEILKGLEEIDGFLQHKSDDQTVFMNVKDRIDHLLPAVYHKDLIQTDLLIKFDNNNLNQTIVEEIVNEISTLSCLNQNHKNKDLEEFKNKLYQKYEEQEIPLLMALDTDSGLGYGSVSGDLTHYSPLIDGLSYEGKDKLEHTVWTNFQKWLLRLFVSSQKNNTHINITTADLQELTKDKQEVLNIQSNFYAIGNIIADGIEEFDLGNYQFLLNYCGGSSAFNLLGRFSKEGDELFQVMKNAAHIEVAQNENKIIAEIVHYAGDRIGNILTRPKIFEHEISFLGNTSAEGDFRISAADLFISVKNNRLVLRSGKLNKEVIPRLTSAHNYDNGLPFYKFVCDLQFQDFNFGLKWDWSFLRNELFLPRVTFNKIILSRSQWRISLSEVISYYSTSNNDPYVALTTLMQKRNIPSEVLLADGDNELYLDMSCVASKEILIGRLKKGNVVLIEFLQSSLLNCGENYYANEVIIPIQNLSYVPIPTEIQEVELKKRSYLPGEDWLYLKIYASNRWMDHLLMNDISSLIKILKKKDLISEWFFIRYRDPDPHLRIRFKKKGGVKNFENTIIKLVNHKLSPLFDNKIISKLQYDTYIQEIEKYGQDAMAVSESIFFNDSEAVLEILNETQGDESLKWLAALHVMDYKLSDFDFSLIEKYKFVSQVHQGFFKEFNEDKDLNKRLNDTFRINKGEISMALTNSEHIFESSLASILFQRREKTKHIISKLIATGSQQEKLISNYIHLFVNRLFPANQRLMELTLYHFLKKNYESQIARSMNLK